VSLIIAIVLIVANGLFVAMEFALLASLRTRIEEESDKLRGRLALRSMGRLGTVLAGTQLGVTLSSLALGSVAEPAADRFLEEVFHNIGVPESLSAPIALVIALAVVVFFHLVIGEMVPKSIALSQPERTLLNLVLPASAFVWLFRPVIWVLNRLAFVGSRLFGVEPADELRSTASAAELGLMIEESRDEGLIADEDHELLTAALGFLDRGASSVMVPRHQIVSIPRSATVADAEEVVHASGHSRVLVVGRDLDDVVGFVHAKDLLRVPLDGRQQPVPLDAMRMTLTVDPDRGLGDVLLAMRRARRHVAVVSDAERRTVGMVTMEDVLEAIVGDIVDETDQE